MLHIAKQIWYRCFRCFRCFCWESTFPGRGSFMVGDWRSELLRISRKRVQLEAPGLSSYVAASCGGALGRLCLTQVSETDPIPNPDEDVPFRLEDLEYINENAQPCLSFTDALIGEGAGGRVFRARHKLQTSPSSPFYAVNVFRTKENTLGRAPPEVARECEVGTCVRQTPHPCIVRLHMILFDETSGKGQQKLQEFGCVWCFVRFSKSLLQVCLSIL